ncbi:MAG TPA: hypothetical protein VD908_15770 [Cytophagales bacterium]|nr:hypothetical protein [Cytophagales bacterium]
MNTPKAPALTRGLVEICLAPFGAKREKRRKADYWVVRQVKGIAWREGLHCVVQAIALLLR